jgi:hypothetical protein
MKYLLAWAGFNLGFVGVSWLAAWNRERIRRKKYLSRFYPSKEVLEALHRTFKLTN